jgi:hypothetical protein
MSTVNDKTYVSPAVLINNLIEEAGELSAKVKDAQIESFAESEGSANAILEQTFKGQIARMKA